MVVLLVLLFSLFSLCLCHPEYQRRISQCLLQSPCARFFLSSFVRMTGVFVRLHFCQVFIILYFLFFCSAKLIVHASTIARKNEENAFFDEKCQKNGHFWMETPVLSIFFSENAAKRMRESYKDTRVKPARFHAQTLNL